MSQFFRHQHLSPNIVYEFLILYTDTMKRLLSIIIALVIVMAVVQPAVAAVSIPNPITCDTATCLVGQTVRYILGVIAILATLMFVWGGILMLTSGGNSQRIEQAKQTLAWAAIGVVVILLSWSIILFVLKGLVG